MHSDESIKLFGKIYGQINPKWSQFIKALKLLADPENQSQIYFDDFVNTIKKFKGRLSSAELDYILEAFPGMEGERGPRMNIARIFDMQYINTLDTIFKKVDMENTGGMDDPTDELGYHGKTKWARPKVIGKITECSEEEFAEVIKRDPLKLHKVMLTIRQIDKDHNGYVTRNELDDILKMYFEGFLHKNYDKLLIQFSSIQNRILIDYMRFIEWVKRIIQPPEKTKSKRSSYVTAHELSEMQGSRSVRGERPQFDSDSKARSSILNA